MIITEVIENNLKRTFSSDGFYIYGGNPVGNYSEAIDPVELERTYVETDIRIDEETSSEELLDILLGGAYKRNEVI